MSPDSSLVDKEIQELKDEKLNIEDQGDIANYLGINFNYEENGIMFMFQPQLIDQLIVDVKFKNTKNLPDTPALSTHILQQDKNAAPFNKYSHYRSVVKKLNYLEKGTRPDIGYGTHQYARFCEDPRASYGKVVEHLVKYLKSTRKQGIILKLDKTKSLEVYVDADFSGNWNKNTAEHDASTAKSRTGFVVMYAGCPIIWSSKLQTQVALSTTEVEYISLSQSLREVILVINLPNEMKENNISSVSWVPNVYCKAFEDNSGALELAKLPRMQPRTKHINLVYHHLKEYKHKAYYGTNNLYVCVILFFLLLMRMCVLGVVSLAIPKVILKNIEY